MWKVSPMVLIRLVRERDLAPTTYLVLISYAFAQAFLAVVFALGGAMLIFLDFILGTTGGILVFQGEAEFVASIMFAVVATAMTTAVMYRLSRGLPVGETLFQTYVVVGAAVVLGTLDALFGIKGVGHYTGYPVTLTALLALEPVAWFEFLVVGGLDLFGELIAGWLFTTGLMLFGIDGRTLGKMWKEALRAPKKHQLPPSRPPTGSHMFQEQRQKHMV